MTFSEAKNCPLSLVTHSLILAWTGFILFSGLYRLLSLVILLFKWPLIWSCDASPTSCGHHLLSGAPGCSQIGGQAGLLAEGPGQPLTLNQALRDPLCDRGPLSQVSSQQCAVPRMDSRVDATPLGPGSSVKRVPTPPPSVCGWVFHCAGVISCNFQRIN